MGTSFRPFASCCSIESCETRIPRVTLRSFHEASWAWPGTSEGDEGCDCEIQGVVSRRRCGSSPQARRQTARGLPPSLVHSVLSCSDPLSSVSREFPASTTRPNTVWLKLSFPILRGDLTMDRQSCQSEHESHDAAQPSPQVSWRLTSPCREEATRSALGCVSTAGYETRAVLAVTSPIWQDFAAMPWD